MSAPVSLSVIIPCYNEEQRISSFVLSWHKFLSSFGAKLNKIYTAVEVIFVDDGSKDQTRVLLERACKEITSDYVTASYEALPRNQGKGAAVRRGFELSHGDFVLMTDVDLSSPLSELFKLIEANVDFAVGSRALGESYIVVRQPGVRPSLGRVFNLFIRLVTGMPFLDTQCGFKLVRGSLARIFAQELHENRFAFDVELCLIANHQRASMAEVAVEWAHQEPTRVVLWKDGLHMGLKVLALVLRRGRWRS